MRRILALASSLLLVVLSGCTVYKNDGPGEPRPSKVAICHKGQTLRLPDNAIRAHLNHGDRLGVCRAEG